MHAVIPIVLLELACPPAFAGGDAGADTPPPFVASRTEKGLTFEVGKSKMNFDVFFQPRFTFRQSGDPDVDAPDRWDGTGFQVRRMLFLANGVLTPRLGYTFRVNFAGTKDALTSFSDDGDVTMFSTATFATPVLDDARLNYKVADAFQVAFGRFKVPYSGHWLVGVYDLAFPERSAVIDGIRAGGLQMDGFGYKRDTGLAITGNAIERRVDWAVGVFSGDGGSTAGLVFPPADDGYLYTARIAVAPLGAFEMRDLDTKHGRPRLGLGVNAGFDDNPVYGHDRRLDASRTDVHLGGEVRFAASGLNLQAEYHLGRTLGDDDTAKANGFLVQGTYVIPDPALVPGLRFSRMDPDAETHDDGYSMAEATLAWLLPEPGAKKAKDRTNRRKVQIAYTLAKADASGNLAFHQVMLAAQAGL
ncbi:MAG: hypothetical protein JXB39_00335 [Deltaproteobacteria bacterium]|nr:hypothetical protein [Deltaproteobacteria bacterium]